LALPDWRSLALARIQAGPLCSGCNYEAAQSTVNLYVLYLV
jgi:hypothetical protein